MAEQGISCQDKQVLVSNGEHVKQTRNYQLLSRDGQGQDEPDGHRKRRSSRYVITCALFASLNSVLLGYDIGIMSGAVLFIKEDLGIHEFQESVLMSSLNLVSLFGGLLAGRLADAIGRKLTMAIASLTFLIGAGAMGIAPTFPVLLLGRVISGIGVGFGLMIAPVYTAELAPSGSRGALVSFPEVFINVGILIGYVMSYLLSGLAASINWRLMLGAGCIPAFVLAAAVMFMPESPRWLVMQNRIDEAKQVLSKTSGDNIEAEQRLSDIIGGSGLEVTSGLVKTSQGQGIWRELLWPVPSVRKMLLVVLGVQFFQQASGIDALIYYSPAVFNEAGIKSKTGLLATTVAVGFAKTLAVLVATIFLDRVGRRPLLLASSIGMTASLGAVAMGFVFFDVETSSNRLPVQSLGGNSSSSLLAVSSTLVAICFFMVFFSIGFGPVCWVLTSEVFPLRLRAQAVSLAVVVSRLVSGIVTLTFLGISETITPAGAFFIFCFISAASGVFVYVIVPETKGKSLEEVGMFFEKKQQELQEDGNVELGEVSSFPDDFVDEDPAELPAYDHASLLARVKQIANQSRR